MTLSTNDTLNQYGSLRLADILITVKLHQVVDIKSQEGPLVEQNIEREEFQLITDRSRCSLVNT